MRALLATVIVLILAADARAAAITYFGDSLGGPVSPAAAESQWLAAAQAPVRTEGFESFAVTDPSWPHTSLTGNGVTVSGTSAEFGIWSDPRAGDHAIDGVRWIQTHGLQPSSGTRALRFDGFAAPIDSFALWVTDYETAGAMTLTIDGPAGGTFTLLATGAGRDAGESFFGVHVGAGESFTQAVLTWQTDYIGIDKVMFGAAPVPEPATGALLAVGAAAVLARRRRKAA
jgi:hypothetical protein